jgi:hypothetical protein
MPLTASGMISLSNLAAEFSDTAPFRMSEFYGGGALVASTTGVPTSGILRLTNFYGKSRLINSYITETSGLIAYYTGESWTGTQWNDLSGNSNHATNISGIVTTATQNGYIYLAASSTASSIIFPAAILPSQSYTLFHLSRKPVAGENSRIFASQSTSPLPWLSGFNGTSAGVAYHGNWITPLEDNNGTEWVLSTDQHNLYKANKVNRTTASPGSSYALSPIGLNAYIEKGIWNCACVLVYNRILTNVECHMIENELIRKYNTGSPIVTTSGLIGYYTADNFTGTQWTDISGNNNHATMIRGTPVKVNTESAINNQSKLTFTTNDGIRFPTAILPSNYTMFHVARHTGTTNNRIFDGVIQNWLSGFWMGRTGCAYHNNWITPQTYIHETNWVLSTDQNSLYRSNKINRTTASPGTPSYDNISINYGYWTGERSTCEVACVLVYNRTLSATEYHLIENELSRIYKIGSSITTTSGLIGYYVADSYTGTQWTDLSGKNNHATVIRGTPTKVDSALNRQSKLTFTTNDGITFPSGILPPTYTVFHIARYTGTTSGRIFTGTSTNWLSGFWNGYAGVAYHNNWITPFTNWHQTNWVLSTDQNALYRSNKVKRSEDTTPPGNPSYDTIAINAGSISPAEVSTCEVCCLLVYNRTLTQTEYVNIENELSSAYGI